MAKRKRAPDAAAEAAAVSAEMGRVLRLMRNAGLLVPQRGPTVAPGPPRRTITDAPNVRWGTDATMAWTRNDGWVWASALLDHYTDEAWAHVTRVGNRKRFASLQPVYDAVLDRLGGLEPTWPEASSSATTGAANIEPTTSKAPSTGDHDHGPCLDGQPGTGAVPPMSFLQEKLVIAIEMEVTPAPPLYGLRCQTGTVRSRLAHRGCE